MAHPGWITRAAAAVGGLTLAVAGLTAPIATHAAAADTSSTGVSAPGGIVPVVYDPTHTTPTTVGPVVPNGLLRASSGGGATFVVNYDAGFDANPQAKAAFQFAVDQWSQTIVSPVPIVVDASFGPLGSGILGGAGPSSLRANFTGAPVSNTWYPIALANALHGSDLDATSPDIGATFSSSFTGFYFGTDGNTGGKVDFASVVMHELGHGLGFLGVMDVSAGSGSCCLGPYPSTYDRFTTSNGVSLLSIAEGASLATALQGQTVRFTGANATAANGGTSPRLYTPATWEQGSSYSHLDEDTFPAGDPDSLMTPGIGSNEVIHSPGPIVLGIFADTGWTVGSPPDLSIGSARVVEGNYGTRGLRFTVSLSEPASRSVTFSYKTVDGTALAATDYQARTGTATINAGSTSRTVTITVRGDKTVEAGEKFKVVISNPQGANLGINAGTGRIDNDDAGTGVQVSIGDASVREGDDGDRIVTLPVTLSAQRTKVTTVDWSSSAGSAGAGSDYEDDSGTASFPAGTTTQYVTFTVHPDTGAESNETFAVTLSNASGAAILRATGTATIADDD